jgi:rubrerythrin
MQRSFVSLSPKEALQVAISIEERNAGLYHRFTELFTEFGDEESLEIAAVFWEMALEERSHASLLQHKHTERYGDVPCALTEDELVEIVEVPKLGDGDVFGKDETPGRTRALNVALQAELSAQQFYSRLAEQAQHAPLRDLFLELAEMEDSHVAYLEHKLAQDGAEQPSVQ